MKTKITAFLIVMIFCAVSGALAHPPLNIKISFDPETKILKGTFFHPVTNGKAHYVEAVEVRLNGEKILSQQIEHQEGLMNQTVMYYISDAESGDELSLEGVCNKSGQRMETISI